MMVRVAAMLVLVGCYDPHVAPCSASIPCPDGQTCSPTTHTCEARTDDAAQPIDSPEMSRDAANDAALAQPALVQHVENKVASATTLTAALPAMPAPGDVLVMIGGSPVEQLTSVTGGGATWIPAARSNANANIELWYGVTDGTSSTITLTAPGESSITMHVGEWSGLAKTNLVDGAGEANGAASPAGASIVTTNVRDVLVFAVADFTPNTFGTPTPDTWTALPAFADPISQAAWYRIQTAAGTVAPSVTETEHRWDAVVVALRIAP